MGSTLKVGVLKSRKAEASNRGEAGPKGVRRGPILLWPWKVTPLHKSQSPKRLRKSGLHPFVLLLHPSSTELVRVMGNLAQIQHHYREKRGPPEKWLRASFQKWEPSFQPLFFEAATPPPTPLYLFYLSAERANGCSCVRSDNTCVRYPGMDKEFQWWAWSTLREDKMDRGVPTALSSRWLRLWPVSPVYNHTPLYMKDPLVLAPFWSERKVIIIFTWLWHQLWIRRGIM